VKCSYSETYPGTPLITEVRRDDDLDGDLDDDDANELQEIMDSEATENIGMVHVFSVISKVQEQLNLFVDRIKQRKEAEKDRKKFLEEEEERKKNRRNSCNCRNFSRLENKIRCRNACEEKAESG